MISRLAAFRPSGWTGLAIVVFWALAAFVGAVIVLAAMVYGFARPEPATVEGDKDLTARLAA